MAVEEICATGLAEGSLKEGLLFVNLHSQQRKKAQNTKTRGGDDDYVVTENRTVHVPARKPWG
jgi:hypothetical protein